MERDVRVIPETNREVKERKKAEREMGLEKIFTDGKTRNLVEEESR